MSSQEPETSALDAAMDRYAAGEDAAFNELYTPIAQRLLPFLRRMCGSLERAEDLLQETFVRMHRARGSFGKGAAVMPWAYAIARNCYIDSYRAKKSRPKEVSRSRDSDAPPYPEPHAGPEASGEAQLAASQMAEVVQQALDSMTLARREAFVLVRYEGHSIREAAAILGTTEGAVKLRAFHAYQEIRTALEQAGLIPAGGADK
ncbi:MAG: RNA polymerase sigma factor [Polyangiaceae bacterium]